MYIQYRIYRTKKRKYIMHVKHNKFLTHSYWVLLWSPPLVVAVWRLRLNSDWLMNVLYSQCLRIMSRATSSCAASCMYTHIIYTYTCIHVYIYTYIHIYIYTYEYLCTHVFVCVYICVYTHVCTYSTVPQTSTLQSLEIATAAAAAAAAAEVVLVIVKWYYKHNSSG